MTCASCSSPKIRAQETSQLLEVPPTNSDDTITSAPRPPTDLTTETEPRIESPNTSQLLNSNCTHNAANQFDNSDYTPSLQETRRPKLRQQFNLCANRTLLANSHNHLCQHDTTSLSRGVETRPHPTESHDQLGSDVGLVWLERPLHLVLKGLFLLRTLRVSAGTHAADRTSDAPLHRTDELLNDGEIFGQEHNALLVVVTRKAPQDVQRRCLLHVQHKVVKAC